MSADAVLRGATAALLLLASTVAGAAGDSSIEPRMEGSGSAASGRGDSIRAHSLEESRNAPSAAVDADATEGAAHWAAGRSGSDAFDRTRFRLALAGLDASARPMPDARILIVPHHWLAAEMIVEALRDLRASTEVSGLVLIGPDHHEALPDPGATTDADWRTAYGVVPVDQAIRGRLLATGLVRQEDALLRKEHSIAGLVPALARVFPGVPVTPLAVRNDTRGYEAEAIGRALQSTIEAEPGLVIVLSADFSHGLGPREAAARDRETLMALEDLDLDRIASFDSQHVDARGALSVVLAAARHAGLTQFVLREESDSSRERCGSQGGYAGGPVTSYIVAYYRRPSGG